jgi:hypothetical protein
VGLIRARESVSMLLNLARAMSSNYFFPATSCIAEISTAMGMTILEVTVF